MSWRIAALRVRRLRHRHGVRGNVLAQCWQRPLPSTATDWRDSHFLACDAEMSGLDVGQAELLSLGWVDIDGGAIQLDSAEHHLIRPQASVGQSATIHQLRDCEFDDASSLSEVLERFLAAAAGKVLVFHNAVLDLAFLDRACLGLFGSPLLMPYVDTLALEHRLLTRRNPQIGEGQLRLQACRDRYKLPDYGAHNALVDALATAELLAAHASKRAAGGKLALGALL